MHFEKGEMALVKIPIIVQYIESENNVFGVHKVKRPEVK